MNYTPPEIYIFPRGKVKELRSSIFWGRVRVFFWAAVIFFLFGIVSGYAWRYIQVEPERDKQIASLKEKIEHYRSCWTPIREKEGQSIKGAGKKAK